MNKSWLVLIVALFIFTPQLLAEEKAEPETRTLTGAYEWSARGSGGDLEAVFTPTGENTWNVSFHFTFRGDEHTYTGTAEGGLGDGSLSGTVLNETEKRTFTFTGEFAEGEFSGTHAERHGESDVDTGTITLKEG
jgi:hypothetical protein